MKQNLQKFQHQKSNLGSIEMHSWMFPYMLGYRDRVPFFNTEETLIATQKAIAFLQHIQKTKGSILLVNTNPTFGPLVKKTASIANLWYVNEHWIGGLLTN